MRVIIALSANQRAQLHAVIYPGHSSYDSVTLDEDEGGCETASELVCKPQVGGSVPLAGSTTSADVSTPGVFQYHVPS
jgi:hypothetical protein